MPKWKPPIVPPISRQIGLSVLGPPEDTIALVLLPDLGQLSDGYAFAGVREPGTRHFVWTLPRRVTGGAWLDVAALGYVSHRARLVLPQTSTELPAVTLSPLAPTITLEHLRVRGQFFETISGKRWTGIGCSGFNDFRLHLIGDPSLDAVLDERAEIGFNQCRVFLTMNGALGTLRPFDHTNFYEEIPKYAARCAQRGMGVEFTAFADYTRVFTSPGQAAEHHTRVAAALQGLPQIFYELVNESDQMINRMNTDAFAAPEGLIASHGSNGADSLGVTPIWGGYTSYHPARPHDWPRRGGHTGMEIADEYRTRCTVNEGCRPDQGRGPIASDHFDAAANIALLCAGGCFHSHAGKYSLRLSSDERRCAEAWVAGAKAVPLEYQDGKYSSGHLHDSPFVHEPGKWAHARLLGDKACVSTPQADGWVPVPKDGWRIVSQDGSVILLER